MRLRVYVESTKSGSSELAIKHDFVTGHNFIVVCKLSDFF